MDDASMMGPDDFAKLLEDTETELLRGNGPAALLGLDRTTLRLIETLTVSGLISSVEAVYSDKSSRLGLLKPLAVPVRPLEDLSATSAQLLVCTADEAKEMLLESALPFLIGTPKVIVAGYGHFRFRDALFEEELAQLLVPSLANGYPNSLIHLYQCLINAWRLGLEGVVAEFGVFKGGTTMFISRILERLNIPWRVIGFDAFGGFPPRRSPLDMYDHPDCVFTNKDAVIRYLSGRDVEIVEGDIVTSASRLATEDVVVSFIDTDNYTPAAAAIEVVRERTLVGGAIVFDHYTGTSRFRYTLGERMAGRALLDDPRYFNLHGTGVFLRQR